MCHGNEHHGIDPNMSNSGHHDCCTKPVFLCTADKLKCCQHVGTLNSSYLSIRSFHHPSFVGTIEKEKEFKHFCFEIALGLALGRSWLLLAQPQRNTNGFVYIYIIIYMIFAEYTHSSPCVAKLNKSVWCETRMLSATGVFFPCTAAKLQCCHMLAC